MPTFDPQQKTKSTPKWRHQQIAHKNQRIQKRKAQDDGSIGQHAEQFSPNGLDDKDPDGVETRRAKGSQAPRTFSQPSVISTGDKGIFVTTDIGREKKGLIEIGGLVEEYLEEHGFLDKTQSTPPEGKANTSISGGTGTTSNANLDEEGDDSDMDIEISIKRELSGLTSDHSHHTGQDTEHKIDDHQSRQTSKPFQLITLDVPCVSFLRFHPLHTAYSSIDPVHIAHSICDQAMKTGIMRSRFIRRLSPISWLGKTLGGGLEKCSAMILPSHFDVNIHNRTPEGTTILQEEGEDVETIQTPPPPPPPPPPQLIDKLQRHTHTNLPVTFAIRPTLRNNDKLTRSQIIEYIADQITLLGQGKHKVDLKNYQKGVLVDVYRGYIGMSVVDNNQQSASTSSSTSTLTSSEFTYGYEELKRFNLAEIYAADLTRRK